MRLNGHPDSAAAADLDFGSVEQLYRQIKEDGHPICAVCGTTYVQEGHCKEPEKKRERKARSGGGEKRELPSATAAAELFRRALKRLEHDIAELSRRREYMQDEKFIVERLLSGDAGEHYKTYHRDGTPEPLWREFCEEHGADPGMDSVTVWEDTIVSGGVSWAPPEPLTRLIAVYILADQEPLEFLLKTLHDDPEAANREQLGRHIHNDKVGLASAAQRVARLVRGAAIIPPGPRTSGLSRREEEAAVYIGFQRSCGVSDEKILQELRDGFGFSKPAGLFADPEEVTWPDMKMDDLKRLGKFRLPSIFGDGTSTFN